MIIGFDDFHLQIYISFGQSKNNSLPVPQRMFDEDEKTKVETTSQNILQKTVACRREAGHGCYTGHPRCWNWC